MLGLNSPKKRSTGREIGNKKNGNIDWGSIAYFYCQLSISIQNTSVSLKIMFHIVRHEECGYVEEIGTGRLSKKRTYIPHKNLSVLQSYTYVFEISIEILLFVEMTT